MVRRDEQGFPFALQVSGDLKTPKCSVSLLVKFLAAGYGLPLCKMFYKGLSPKLRTPQYPLGNEEFWWRSNGF